MARYLRIAAAVVFALLALAFVALWVRSYYWIDEVNWRKHQLGLIAVQSEFGAVQCVVQPRKFASDLFLWTHEHVPTDVWLRMRPRHFLQWLWFRVDRGDGFLF